MKRRWKWGRRLLWLVVVLGLLGLAGRAFLSSATFERWVARAVEAELERRTGAEAQVGGLTLRAWPPRARVDGLMLRDRATREPLVGLMRGTVQASFEGWRPKIKTIELDNPSVRLRFVDGVLQGFPAFQGGGGGGGELPEELPWEELVIRDGSVRLAFEGAEAAGEGAQIALEGLSLVPSDGGRVKLSIQSLGVSVAGVEQAAEGVVIPDITLGTDRIVLPEVALDFPAVQIAGRAAARLGGEVAGLFQVSVDPGELNHLLPEGVMLLGDWSADLEVYGPLEAPLASVAIAGRPVVMDTRTPESPRRYAFGQVSAVGALSAEGARVERLALKWSGGEVEARGELSWDGRLSDGVVRAEGLEFARVMKEVGQATAPWVDFRGDVEIHTEGTLSPFRLSGPYELVVIDFLVGAGSLGAPDTEVLLDIPRGYAGGTLTLDARGARLDTPLIQLGSTGGWVDAFIGFSPTGPLELSLDLSRADLADVAPMAGMNLAGRGRVAGEVKGPFKDLEVRGEASVVDFAALDVPWADVMETGISARIAEGVVRFEDMGATRGATDYGGDLQLTFAEEGVLIDLTAAVEGGRLVDLQSMFLEIPGTDAAVSGGLSLQGPVDALDGHGEFALADITLFGERFSSGRALAWMDEGRFTLEELIATRQGGEETVRVRGSVGKGWAMNAEIIADHLRLETLDALGEASVPVEADLAVDMRVGGTLFSPAPHGRLAARNVTVLGRRGGDGDVYFDTEDEVLRFEGHLLDGRLVTWGTQELFGAQRYEVSGQMDRLPAHLFYPVAADGRPVTAEVSGTARVQGAFGDEPEPVEIDADLEGVKLAWGGHVLENPEPWQYRQRGQAISLSTAKLLGEKTWLMVAGEVSPTGEVELTGQGVLDLDLLRAAVDGVERSEGLAEVAVRFGGQVGAVEGLATVHVEDATLRTEWFPHPLEDLALDIVASPDRYRIQDVRGLLGGGEARGEGTIYAEDWIPTRYELTASVEDAQVRYLDYLPPMTGDARLRFAGPADELLLSGEVDIEEMIFTERIDWEQDILNFQDELLVDLEEPTTGDALFAFDIDIVGDGTIELDNNVARGTADADLHLVGDTSRPGMVGSARMHPGGEVYLQEREFEVSRAELLYDDPYTYDPNLDFLLTTEIESQSEDYTISYRVGGPFSNWTTTPSSEPYLSQGDINSLLLFGVTQAELAGQGGVGSALLQEGADLFLAGLGVESAPLDLIGLDRFTPDRIDLVSGVSERGPVVNSEWRLLIEKDIPEPWELTIIGEILLDNQLDQYWAVEKNLNRDLYTSLYWSSQQLERNLDIGGAYGVDFKIRWEIE